jgi:hypothetical protein
MSPRFMGLTLPAAIAAVVAVVAMPDVHAQNGTNDHVLHNGLDVIYNGIGAGGAQTKADGLGTWVAGEDLRGSHLVNFSNDFGVRMSAWRENACPIKISITGPPGIEFRGIEFVEMDGLNGNNQAIFTSPGCTNPSFPLGGSAGFIPFGTGPGSPFSFGIFGLPAGVGPTPSAAILLPNNGLIPGGGAGTATIVGAASNIFLPINSTGYCWGVTFKWQPSALALTDDIDGLWHYVINASGNYQYWGFSDDEMNLWQSNSVATDGQLTVLRPFLANADYAMTFATVEPATQACLAPRGRHLGGPYYHQTENVTNEFGVALHPNGGFDLGRGSAAISFSGTAGVPDPVTGFGNQNAVSNPTTVTTLGFATFDNGGDHDGSVRLTWVSIDILGLQRLNPDLDPGITKFGGQIRLPVVSAGLMQPVTSLCLGLFGHVTRIAPSGWPDPDGFSAGTGSTMIAGASWQIPTGLQPAACIGTKVNLTYGTTGRKGVVGAPGQMTFDPSIADTSGSRELYLFN